MKSICFVVILLITFSINTEDKRFKHFNVSSSESSFILTSKDENPLLKNKIIGKYNIIQAEELMKTVNNIKTGILNFDSKIGAFVLFDKKGIIFYVRYFIGKDQINHLKEIELYNFHNKLKSINLLHFIEIPNSDKFDYGTIYIPLEKK